MWHGVSGEGELEPRATVDGVPTLLYITRPRLSVSRVFLRAGLYRADDADRTDALYLDAITRRTSFRSAVAALDGR